MIDHQRQLIAEEMKSYDFSLGNNLKIAKNLKQFTPETGGTPIRSIIVSTWRSGSTFFGDILDSVPGNFYHYEPLIMAGNRQIRNSSETEASLKKVKRLLNCDFSDMEDYLNFAEYNRLFFQHIKRLWPQCELLDRDCYQTKFLDAFCKLFPIQSMKIVRLRAGAFEKLLSDSR